MTQNLRSMKTKMTKKNCNTIENVSHTTHKCVNTIKKERVLTFPLRQKCHQRVFWKEKG